MQRRFWCWIGIFALAAPAWAEPPTARQILEQAQAAMKAVQTVRYDVTCEGSGGLAATFPKMTGTVTLAENPGVDQPRLVLDVQFESTAPGVMARVQCANDGHFISAIDHERKAYTRREMPGGMAVLRNFQPLFIYDFVTPAPLAREAKADTLEAAASEKVGDVECDVITASFTEDKTRIKWYFGKEDHLPRRVERAQPSPVGEAVFTTSLANLNTKPEVKDDLFRLAKPEGYVEPQVPEGRSSGLLPAGADAPDWTLKDTDGKEVTLKSLRGKIVFLDFWATWCGPCRIAMPSVQKLYESYKDKPVAIYGVNCWERNPNSDPAGFMKQQGVKYPLLLKADLVAQAYKVTGIPTFYLIGPDGKVLMSYAGASSQNDETVRKLINETLAKMADKPGDKAEGEKAEKPDEDKKG